MLGLKLEALRSWEGLRRFVSSMAPRCAVRSAASVAARCKARAARRAGPDVWTR